MTVKTLLLIEKYSPTQSASVELLVSSKLVLQVALIFLAVSGS